MSAIPTNTGNRPGRCRPVPDGRFGAKSHCLSASQRRRRGRSIGAFACFLGLFALMLVGVCHWFLLPELDAFKIADARHQRVLATHALLVMSLFLLILASMIVLLFRPGRFFFPRARAPRSQTQYTDAWAEAGKRMNEKNGSR